MIESLERRRMLANAGDPVASFGTRGFLETGRAGAILATSGGTFLQFGDNTAQKRDAAGALVSAFGAGGTATFPFQAVVEPMVLADGKILVLGETNTDPSGDFVTAHTSYI